MSFLSISTEQLQKWLDEGLKLSQNGHLPTYIPQLAAVDPCGGAVCLQGVAGEVYQVGHVTLRFPLMSVIKPFVLLYVLQEVGVEILGQRVGMSPSDQPYYSWEQLVADGGFPRNPMLNSGAIALCDLMPGNAATERTERFRLWLNEGAGCGLRLDEGVLDSVRSHPNLRNLKLVETLTQAGYLQKPEQSLDTYQQVCCLSGAIADISQLGMMLIQPPPSIAPQHCEQVLEIMLTCGLYEDSPHFAQRVGIPLKSGVSGIVLGVIPQTGVIACYSPPLNEQGHSIAGLWWVETFVQHIRNI
ncbi:glutaminase [Spirulina subsalsa FACHB-351]|uniref:glutaminase n=1 Tax=Spirulina subsalsa FACHB-351 TaxID=234711 RepID=A0ABT3LCA6_9CYAN|nr:glutaminase [Spirulina subsalsa]MCW6038620.1 glutaminase [Spirulina subsalsa FACHB-351]